MTSEHILVTLDGPAGVGKTTLAKRVAEALGIAYLDTGAMFRTLGWKLGHVVDSLSEEELQEHINSFVFTLSGCGAETILSVNGVPTGNEIRTEEVGMLASKVAKLPIIRTALKSLQRSMGESTSLVTEGRDMGTVIFPSAQFKIFLDATPEERARRRFDQLVQMGESPDMATLTKQIRERDKQDRNRPVAPLRPAEDANIIDTTSLDIDGVFEAIMHTIRD